MVRIVGGTPPPTVVDPTSGYKILVVEEGPKGDKGDPGPQGEPGTPGLPGVGGGLPLTYDMEHAQTTFVIDHTLGYDPINIQVMDLDDQALCDDFYVSYPLPSQRIMLGWEVPIRARVRIS